MRRASVLLVLSIAAIGCAGPRIRILAEDRVFQDRWHAGEAEVDHYALRRDHLGETREGDALLLFGVRPRPDETAGIAPRGFEVVRIERWVGGIVDHDVWSSATTAERVTDARATLAASASLHRWTGHSWADAEASADGLRLRTKSAGAASITESDAGDAWTEDELFHRIRLAPDSFPSRRVRLVPGMVALCTGGSQPVAGWAELRVEPAGEGEKKLVVEYVASPRRLEIRFEAAFPHGILGWREEVPIAGGVEVVEAKRTHTRMLAWWKMTARSHESLRAAIGLPPR